MKAYLFWLLKVYLINDQIHSTMLMLNKRQRGEDRWMVIPTQIKKTVTRVNLLKTKQRSRSGNEKKKREDVDVVSEERKNLSRRFRLP